MVQMPTGTGKTHLLASVVSEFVSSAGSGVWLIAHRRELVAQMEETLAKYGIRREDTPVRVMSVQWLSRHWNEAGDAPGLIVIDEAHHALAASYTEMWKRYPAAKKLGVTATPCRLNRRGFTELFEVLVTSWSIAEFIEKACCLCSIMYPSVPAARSSGSLTVWRNGGRWGLSGERDGCGTEQASRYRAPVPQCQAVCFRQEGDGVCHQH